MERKSKNIRILLVVLSTLVVILALVGIEFAVNGVYRRAKISSEKAFERTELTAVALRGVPQIKTEKSNFAASVLWAATFRDKADGLTEEKIVEEVGDKMGEYELYAALDKYMSGWKREQVRNLTGADVLKKLHESLSKNRAVLATAEDGKGGARYVGVTAFDPQNAVVSIFDFELGETVNMTESEFLRTLRLENVGSETKTQIFFGAINPNSLMTIY